MGWYIELNQKSEYKLRFSKMHGCYISGIGKGAKLKLPELKGMLNLIKNKYLHPVVKSTYLQYLHLSR